MSNSEHGSFLSRLRGRGERHVEQHIEPVLDPADQAIKDFLNGKPGDIIKIPDEGPIDRPQGIKAYIPDGARIDDFNHPLIEDGSTTSQTDDQTSQ